MAEEMLTTDPPPPSSMRGTAGRSRACAIETLKWKACSSRLGEVSMNGRGHGPADVVDHQVEAAEARRARSTREATASRSLRSAGTARAGGRLPRPAGPLLPAGRRCGRRSRRQHRLRPGRPRRPRPCPRPAPVTTATLSVMAKRSRIMDRFPFVGDSASSPGRSGATSGCSPRGRRREPTGPTGARNRRRGSVGQARHRRDVGGTDPHQQLTGDAVARSDGLARLLAQIAAADDGGPPSAPRRGPRSGWRYRR